MKKCFWYFLRSHPNSLKWGIITTHDTFWGKSYNGMNQRGLDSLTRFFKTNSSLDGRKRTSTNYCWHSSGLKRVKCLARINIPLRLSIFWLFSWGYGLIPDSIELILVVNVQGINGAALILFAKFSMSYVYSRGYIHSRL